LKTQIIVETTLTVNNINWREGMIEVS